ncbi:MAG: efflux RND transporter permease subunit [Rhodobacteraceae bacterium]|nr:efflux RND transporter permease subunit [Paracoccaceae bacterium]
MIRIVEIAASRARMVMAFIILSVLAGAVAYVSLPKEGEPDIEIPMLFVSVPFPGISAADAERILLKPMETAMADVEGLKEMSGTASENYAGLLLEFDFNWDKTSVIADVRDAMNGVEGDLPDGADKYQVTEINFSEFPIIVVNLSGNVPERTLIRLAQKMQDRLEGIDAVLDASLTGYREEMLEVVIDPLRLEAYNVTAGELINVVRNNNQLIAAGEVTTPTGAISVKIPSSFDEVTDVYNLPVKVNGDSVVTLGDLATIRLTFQDRTGSARFNGETTLALQVSKRKGFNLIDTAALIRAAVEEERLSWPAELRQAVKVGTSNDQSFVVGSMVRQLEGSVITAIALVMIVVLASLGIRSALLVGFAIPTSFLLTFALFGALGVTISNIVMFGLILAVGMLVDGAIVVVEYADKRIRDGMGPMKAYVAAAQRMFWPIVSSTATTLCAFLPMLFWPGIPGEFMGMLPKTMIYVLTASLLVALIYLPVMGGLSGRISVLFQRISDALRPLPWLVRAVLVLPAAYLVFMSGMQLLNPEYVFSVLGVQNPFDGGLAILPGAVLFVVATSLLTITLGAARIKIRKKRVTAGYRRSPFGWVIHLISGNPVMPIVAIAAVLGFVGFIFVTFVANNHGTEFFAETEPEQAIIYVRARGNLSLEEKDALVAEVEAVAIATQGIESTFAFSGAGGLNQNTGGASGPRDTIGQVQIEMVAWDDRPHISEEIKLLGFIPFTRTIVDPEFDGDVVMVRLEERLSTLPGVRFEVLNLARGPASAKPVHLRLKGQNWDDLLSAATIAAGRFETTAGLADVEDTRPLPGIDWELQVDVEKAGRYGTDVATVGGMVQLVTTGLLLDTMRVDTSDEEIEIRVRLPVEDRVLSTLDTLKLRTPAGLVPLSNFVTRKPVPTLAQINRVDQMRYFDVKAAVAPDLVRLEHTSSGEIQVVTKAEAEELTQGEYSSDYISTPVTPDERITFLTKWLDTGPFADGIEHEWTGDQEEQNESMAFLGQAFIGALFLMFIILLAQFNSLYNSVLVLLAVILSTTGVLVGMLVMAQPFSIIMTGTGVVALAGIVVNNNIVLIDTYQDYSRYMPRLEAITRTAEARIRPVLLTTITTMAGLAPMMFGLSLDFFNGGYSIDAPTALWWKQLATAVVFGLGIATVLTLVFTPSMLALRVWVSAGAYKSLRGLTALSTGLKGRTARDIALGRAARRHKVSEIVWDFAETFEEEEDAAPIEDEGEVGPALADLQKVISATTIADDTTHATDTSSDTASDAPADTASKPTPDPLSDAYESDGPVSPSDEGNPLKAAE